MSTVPPHSKPPNYSKYKKGSLLNNQIQGLFCVKSKASRLMLGRWYRESCWNGKRKQNMRNMHGVGFPNATNWVCTQTGTNADLWWALPAHAAWCVWSGPWGIFVKSKALHEEQGLHAEMQPIQTPVSILGEGFYYTSQSLSTVWSSVSECQQQHVMSLLSFRVPLSVTAGLCPRGTCTRRWTPLSSSGPISRSRSKCKCPGGAAEWKEQSFKSPQTSF